jgi:hypothetical protein
MRISRLPRHGVFIAAILVTTSCGRTSPVSPDISSPMSAQAAGRLRSGVQVSSAGATFPLVAGSFSIENEKGDRLVGSYAGTANYPDGGPQASTLTLQISDGSGTFSHAGGTIVLEGIGAFVDEGEFVLEGRGAVTLSSGKRTGLVLSLRGASTVGCSTSERIAVLQTATGSMAHAGRVKATLNHEVENTGCSS